MCLPRRSSKVEGDRGCSLGHGEAPAVSSLGTPRERALPETAGWEGPAPGGREDFEKTAVGAGAACPPPPHHPGPQTELSCEAGPCWGPGEYPQGSQDSRRAQGLSLSPERKARMEPSSSSTSSQTMSYSRDKMEGKPRDPSSLPSSAPCAGKRGMESRGGLRTPEPHSPTPAGPRACPHRGDSSDLLLLQLQGLQPVGRRSF